jgi:hypothetical protein
MRITRILSFIALGLLLALSAPAAFAQQSCADIQGCDATGYGVPDAVLAAYPQPDVNPLPIDDKVLYDRIYRKVPGDVAIFNAPGGAQTGSTGAGFSFVTIKAVDGEWSKIDDNQWVRSDALSTDVLVSRYAGVRLPDQPLPYPMAWTMKHLRAAKVPGGKPSQENPFLYRYTRVNLYTYVEVNGEKWYEIGKNQWVHQFDVAKIEPIAKPAGVDTHKWVAVDLYEQVLVAYEGDTPVFSTLVSSGLKQWPTNEGLFHVYLRYPRTTMSGAVQQSDFYSLQEVPWTMYFDHDIALHGTYWHDGFGYRHSHGCVNMSITDAKWLYDWATSEFDYTVSNDTGPAVYVYSSGAYTN